ncbi:HIT domain-containing protein [Mariprofundus erugo]|uniref:HIT domain-containing protein n=1 Tax=Mariprofundus erugo TaxID=2528639 RepID=A0A5R9GQL4_9PROT|nr:HIT domain-containing protein [Mariprofundus erugo]TLS66557.1 HIT domain-containing protein [Mariprofundus erugo]TLS77813.1 HIT domain-containing protein [Mariprofundus erugo]
MILHPQLEKDCFVLGQLPLSALLLINDRNYPWFILVPQREGIREIHQLSEADQQQLMRESSLLASWIEQAFHADKINIAALGNMVPQLHIHHIVRYQTDPAWPAPVWGKVPAIPYTEAEKEAVVAKVAGLEGLRRIPPHGTV